MYGLEAIIRAQGFEKALIGGFIVFFGLSALSFLIFQFHYILNFFENRKIKIAREEGVEKILESMKNNNSFGEISKLSELYMSLSNRLDKNFKLVDLYRLSIDKGFPYPYISIRNFRIYGILIPLGKGYFSWKRTSD